MFAKSADWKSGVAEIFGQVIPQMRASHTERLFVERAVAAWYSTEAMPGWS